MKYVVKVAYVDAIQFTRNNIDEVKEFLGDKFIDVTTERCLNGKCTLTFKHAMVNGSNIQVMVNEGDYIIKNDDGRISHMREVYFRLLYEPVEEQVNALSKAFAGPESLVTSGEE